ncbi:MAG: DUF3791 domain-containing protein [Clostridia bacterium]|nr:DUF3791 domain-containing protein [Clostridia bacterium]
MSETARKKLNYTIACIHEFARLKQITKQAAFEYLDQYKGINFLSDHYEIEHTLSMQDAMNDLEMICRNNGGSLS